MWCPLLSQANVKAEEGLASTSPITGNTEGSWSFKPPLREDQLIELSHKNFALETMKKVRWTRKMYREWLQYRNGLPSAEIACDIEDPSTITAMSLRFALCRFITKVKKVDSTDFPGKTLYDILICIQFHLECLDFAFKVINDPAFRDVKYTLDNTMKLRVASGIGLSVKQAEVLSVTDEDYLWSLGFLGTSHPQQLLNAVVFRIGKGFALHAGKEHRALRGLPYNSQLKFMKDDDSEYYLRYTEDIGLKTNKGGIKHKKVTVKTVDLYATDRPERCPCVSFSATCHFSQKTAHALPFIFNLGRSSLLSLGT